MKKNESPQQVRRVIQSLLAAMDEQGCDTIDRPFLEAIIARCDKELAR